MRGGCQKKNMIINDPDHASMPYVNAKEINE